MADWARTSHHPGPSFGNNNQSVGVGATVILPDKRILSTLWAAGMEKEPYPHRGSFFFAHSAFYKGGDLKTETVALGHRPETVDESILCTG